MVAKAKAVMIQRRDLFIFGSPSSLVVRASVQRSGVAFQFSFSKIVEKSLERSKTMVATG
jgi:hypothetical protein